MDSRNEKFKPVHVFAFCLESFGDADDSVTSFYNVKILLLNVYGCAWFSEVSNIFFKYEDYKCFQFVIGKYLGWSYIR